MIPRRLIRTVPESPSPEQDRMWEIATKLHPDWEHVDLRDPVDRSRFPVTRHLWDRCDSGAQLADLIRAEELSHRGGVYIDSDVECYRSFDPLLGLDGFAGYEDADHVCTAVLGFTAGHPAVKALMDVGMERHHQGTWAAAIGVVSEIWPGRDDMLLLPPGSFFPYHYQQKWTGDVPSREQIRDTNPWAFCAHHWDGSWLR
jgi:Glycosyltransferase sugar-binding region containing DXD motif